VRELPKDPAIGACTNDGRSSGRGRREAVGACKDKKIAFLAEDAFLDKGVPERDRPSRYRPRRADPCLRTWCDDEIPGGPNLHLWREALASEEEPRAFMDFSRWQFSPCDLPNRSTADFSEESPAEGSDQRFRLIHELVHRCAVG